MTLVFVRSARSKVQPTARHCVNDYWLHLCSSVQRAADTGTIRGLCGDVKGIVTNTEQDNPIKVNWVTQFKTREGRWKNGWDTS